MSIMVYLRLLGILAIRSGLLWVYVKIVMGHLREEQKGPKERRGS